MISSLIKSIKNQLTLIENKIHQDESNCQYICLKLSLEEEIPLSPISINDSFFLSKPDSHFALLGLGSFISLNSKGDQRFSLIKKEFSNLLTKWYQFSHLDYTYPTAFLAFAFDGNDPMNDAWAGFPNTLLNIPILLIKQQHSSQTLYVNIKRDQINDESTFVNIKELLAQLIDASKLTTQTNRSNIENQCSEAVKHNWQSLAQQAINEIQLGQFDKLVASRRHSLPTESPISVKHLIQDLIKHYPCCTIFCSQIADKTMIAASPEKLVTLQHPDIQSDALGGTIFRAKHKETTSSAHSASLPFFLNQKANQTEAETSESNKLLKEHQFISQAIYQSLDPLCHTLKMPVAPYLIKLQNLYHLETPIQGKLMDDYDLFDAIKALHPTPAVAGLPTQKAKNWLIENENYNRGWYTGAFGWLDGDKHGDLSVMLRCALIDSKHSTLNLFAGAGLVAESTPEAEWQETELKMKTILEML